MVNLVVSDIDLERGTIHIRQSKGRKDRLTILSELAKIMLKQYLLEQAPQKWLFPSGILVHKLDNDIDLLVEFNQPVGLEFISLKLYLETVLDRKVDLVTVDTLRPIMKDHILNEVQYQ